MISEFVSIDGVVQDPTARAKVMLDEALGAKAFLLGRTTWSTNCD